MRPVGIVLLPRRDPKISRRVNDFSPRRYVAFFGAKPRNLEQGKPLQDPSKIHDVFSYSTALELHPAPLQPGGCRARINVRCKRVHVRENFAGVTTWLLISSIRYGALSTLPPRVNAIRLSALRRSEKKEEGPAGPSSETSNNACVSSPSFSLPEPAWAPVSVLPWLPWPASCSGRERSCGIRRTSGTWP